MLPRTCVSLGNTATPGFAAPWKSCSCVLNIFFWSMPSQMPQLSSPFQDDLFPCPDLFQTAAAVPNTQCT